MKKKIKYTILTIILLLIISLISLYLILKYSKTNYEILETNFKNIETRKIKIGIPKYSFLIKNNDRSYSFKNIKKETQLKTEINNYLKTLEKINCNNTIYYYNKENDYSIIEYKIKNTLLYNTISYQLFDGNYCEYLKIAEYNKYIKVGNLYRMGPPLAIKEENLGKTIIELFPQTLIIDDKFQMQYRASYIQDMTTIYAIEVSSGTYEIKDGKLIYTRENIELAGNKNIIPKTSTFKIENNKLILEENYLKDYKGEIILEYVDD